MVYAINIERKRLLKQRREKALQNAKDRKLAKGNPLLTLQATRRTNSASNDTQSIISTNDEIIDAEDADNTAIDVEDADNVAIDAENIDNAAINADNTSNAATDGKKSDDAIMSDNNMDNATTGNGNMDTTPTDETSSVLVPLPP